jgi:hypothetical protein
MWWQHRKLAVPGEWQFHHLFKLSVVELLYGRHRHLPILPADLAGKPSLSITEGNLMTRFRLKVATAAAAVATCATAVTSSQGAQAATVPNMYHCSIYTNQCWQTNPPHVASIINKCYWYSDFVYNAAYAPDTCDKYTAR